MRRIIAAVVKPEDYMSFSYVGPWLIAFLSLVPASLAAQVPAELRDAIRARDEAIAKADASTWDRLTAPSFTVVGEDGRMMSKAQRLAELRKQKPEPFVAPTDEQVNLFGDTAVRRFRSRDLWILDVWLREQGNWRVAAVQVTTAAKK